MRESWLKLGPGRNTHMRGREPFVEVSWEIAHKLVADELRRVQAIGGADAIYGGSYGWASAGRFHHAQGQIHRFLNQIGGYVSSRDSYSYGAGNVIMPHIVAPMDKLLDQHTSWDILQQHTTLFVAFGGVPVKNTQMTAGGAGMHNVRDALSAMVNGGTSFVNISPMRGDLPEAEWLPIRPNTDTALMLALAYILIKDDTYDRRFVKDCCVGFDRVESYLLGRADGCPKSPGWAEAITGLPASRIERLAEEIVSNRTLLNASWSIQRQSHGEQPYWALVTLASLLGQIGLPGGGFGIGYGTMNSVGSNGHRLRGPTFPQGKNPNETFIPVARISDMLLSPGERYEYNGRSYTYPNTKLIYWAGGNPFHHHQDLNRLISAWQRPDTVILHEQYWTASAKAADIVLPVNTTLERDDIGFASREGQVVAMKKMREPLGEARSDFAIFASIAAELGIAEEFTEGLDEGAWLIRMYETWRAGAAGDLGLPPFEEFWKSGRIEIPSSDRPIILLGGFRSDPVGNRLPTPSGKIELFSNTISDFGYDDCPGHAAWLEPHEWLGSQQASRYPLHLLSNQPSRRLHSQLDHASYSRLGKVSGREPIIIHHLDAAARNISDGDVVRVFNDRGACLAGVVLSEDILSGTVTIATGAWFDPVEWDSQNHLDKHGNPNVLTLDVGTSRLAQGTSAQSTLVEVERFDGEVPEMSAFCRPVINAAIANM